MRTLEKLRAELERLEQLARYYDRAGLVLHLQQVAQQIAQVRLALGKRTEEAGPPASLSRDSGFELTGLTDGCG